MNAIGLAYRWHKELLTSRCTIASLAKRQGLSESRIRQLLPLTDLGPEILKAALKGLLPPRVSLDDLLAAAEHPGWPEQSAALGLEGPGGPRSGSASAGIRENARPFRLSRGQAPG